MFVDRRFRGACCLLHQGDELALREKMAGYIGVQWTWLANGEWETIGEEAGQWQMCGWSKVEEREV
jgi:hypothetical protein